MNTPICDFVKEYCENNSKRFHMPGHKGKTFLGFENLDLTEIDGADDLYHPTGIIKKSEENASSLFGAFTCYSTEGSSQCIRAMLSLVSDEAKSRNKKPLILASRNIHKTFLSAVALLDLNVKWLYQDVNASYLSCEITPSAVEKAILESDEKPTALFLTTPDYLGNLLDISKISEICKKYDILLMVDNAHGAYLKFLENSLHPIDLGADICCDSAHKTLPSLTGGAYIHINNNAPSFLKENVRDSLALFGSTSPSYLILQSLDYVNFYLANGYKEKLNAFIKRLEKSKETLKQHGFTLFGNEPLKITLKTKAFGFLGSEIAEVLKKNNIFVEFYDEDFLVLMVTPETSEGDLECLEKVLLSLEKREEIKTVAPSFTKCEAVMSIREAMLSKREKVNIADALGRIVARADAFCPPAVPIAIPSEKINEATIECFKYYGINSLEVVKED